MFRPRMLSSQIGLDHGRHHVWAMDALFPVRVKPWTSSCLGYGCSNGLGHGRHDARAVDALFS